MKTVTVYVDKLNEIIGQNRDAHRAIFLKALEGYQRKVLALLEERIAELKSGKVISHYISMPVPEDHTKDYDRILRMIEMHVEDTIVISQEDFAKYVMDDWEWKEKFLTTTAFYAKRDEE